MKKLSKTLPALLFISFLAAGLIINIFTPDKDFSPRENRALAQMPKFTFKSFFDATFMEDYEKYVVDQFLLRDMWVEIKAYAEIGMFKTDIKGIYISKGGYLAGRFMTPDDDRVLSNIQRVEDFAASAGIPVYFTLLPGAVEIWKSRLPANAPNASQKQIIDLAASKTPSAVYVDSYEALQSRKDEPIYYKTDHHWTTLGAYYGYFAFASMIGYEPGEYPEVFLSKGGFYGTASSSCGLMPGDGDIVELAVPLSNVREVIVREGDKERQISMYDEAALDAKDKYTVFFGGNYPLMIVKSANPGQKLLLIKDSYANAEIPFLCKQFSEVHVIDLRYYKNSISAYIEENEIELVLVSYYVANFVTDTNLVFLTK